VRIAAVLVAVSSILGGCSALPSSGPIASEVAAEEAASSYVVIDLDERVANILARQPRSSFKRVFNDVRPAPDLVIGEGDSVVVTIWEAASGGLFSAGATDRSLASGSRTASIPEQVVARDGTIQVPYVGRIRVTGLRPGEVESEIVRSLTGKAIEPQAVVTIGRNLSNSVTVGGEVAQSSRVPLSVKGDRVLDVLAGAGGIRLSTHDAFIRLTRGGRSVSLAYNALLDHPEENIFLRPGDVITVVREPQTVTAFGGTGKNASIPFESADLTLEEAIAKAGGLVDSQADPGGVFLLRFEQGKLVKQLLPGRAADITGHSVPVVYRLNLRKVNSYFLARSFPVRDKDILYVANSASDPLTKVFRIVGTVSGPVVSSSRIW